MKCLRCLYPLWNISDRRCPECGLEFAPSQYDFEPRSVQFLCPHCKQQYYGTDARGQLVPRDFDCVSCGNHIDMDEMVLIPAANATEEQTRPPINPWLDPEKCSFHRRWFRTIGKSVKSPRLLMDATPPGSSTWRAIRFSLHTVALPWLLGIGLPVLFALFGAVGLLGAARGIAAMLAVTIVWFILPPILIVAWCAMTHFIFAITGSSQSFGRTVQAICYGSGPVSFASIPCLGAYLFPVVLLWWAITSTIMLARAHAASGFRAAVAVLAPVILIYAISVAWGVWIASTILSSTATMMARSAVAVASLQQMRATSVQAELLNAAKKDGQYPPHVIVLMQKRWIGANELSMSTNPLAGDGMALGGTTVGKFDTANDAMREAIVQEVLGATPEGAVAYRVGDFVFTHRGVPVGLPDVWLFIAEDPTGGVLPGSVPATSPAQPSYWVAERDGVPRSFRGSQLVVELAKQNARRAAAGLPPIPDPTTVK